MGAFLAQKPRGSTPHPALAVRQPAGVKNTPTSALSVSRHSACQVSVLTRSLYLLRRSRAAASGPALDMLHSANTSSAYENVKNSFLIKREIQLGQRCLFSHFSNHWPNNLLHLIVTYFHLIGSSSSYIKHRHAC